jgi:hypothetical protein
MGTLAKSFAPQAEAASSTGIISGRHSARPKGKNSVVTDAGRNFDNIEASRRPEAAEGAEGSRITFPNFLKSQYG